VSGRVLVMLVGAGLTLAGCGPAANAGGGAGATPTAARSAGTQTGGPRRLNPCDYFKVSDATTVMGEAMKAGDPPNYSSLGNTTTCSYESSTNGDTITLQVGSGDTASLERERALFKGTSLTGFGDAAYWVNRAGLADFAMAKGGWRIDVIVSRARTDVQVELSKAQQGATLVAQRSGV
jgi:hypothetical protein